MSEQHRQPPPVADVLIIGAGASGGVAALRLVQAGLSVVALEQGEWQDAGSYRGADLDWELTALKQWSANPNVRQAPADYPIDSSQSDMGVINFNGVGGATILYNAVWMRLLPNDFRRRSLFGVADDWPVSYADLQPYYEETDRQVGVSGLAGDPIYPAGADFPLPPFNLKPGPMNVARALHRKGWHWWPQTNAILSAAYDGRRSCIQRGACQTGCNEGAKSSIDVTHWKRVVAAGGHLLTGARVRRILLDDQGLAAGAEWVDHAGELHVQRARTVLCAANGVGTARLLLGSACERFPTGLANRSGLVGRNLMLHPVAKVTGYFHEQLDSWEGPFGSDLSCLEFADIDHDRGFAAGVKWSLQHAGGGPLSEALKVLTQQGAGGEHHARFQQRFGHSLAWTVMCEDMPDPSNRVELSADLKDAAGVPAPKISYRLTADVRAALDFNVARASDVLTDAGAFEVEAINPGAADAHLMGTARMGDDPARSVVDRWGMSHDIPNLGVIDGSVFVTASCVNPTSTICALALRTADHLIGTLSRLPAAGVPIAADALPPPRPPAPQPAPDLAFTSEQRRRLAALADILIPADHRMPSASAVGVADAGLDRVLGARPDLAAVLRRILADDAGASKERLDALAREAPDDHRALLVAVAGAYYTEPRVRALIGYSGQPERPHRPDGYPAYIAEGLLDHLMPAE